MRKSIILISFIINGCYGTITEESFNVSVKLCEPHGGVYQLSVKSDTLDYFTVKCKDKAKFNIFKGEVQ